MKVQFHAKEAPNTWKHIGSNWIIKLSNRIILGITVVSLILFIVRYSSLPPYVPLWYSQPWGNDQLAHPLWLLLLPLGSLFLHAINFLLTVYLLSEYLIFSQIAFLTSLIVSILSFIALAKILFLIT